MPIDNDNDPLDGTMSICRFFETQYKQTVAPNTANDVWTHYRMFHRWFTSHVSDGVPPTLDDITPEHVTACRNWILSQRDTAANSYANKTVAYLRTLRNRAYDCGRHPQPFLGRVRKLKEKRHAPTAWTLEQMGTLFDVIGELDSSRTYGSVMQSVWWRSFVWLAYQSGLRLDTLNQIEWTDAHLDTAVIVIRPETTKAKKGIAITLKRETLDAIEKLKSASESSLMFGDFPYQENTLRKHLRTLLGAAGMPTTNRDLCHKMRRTFATHAYIASSDMQLVSDLLQHSDLSVTKRYIDMTQVDRPTQSEVIPTPPVAPPATLSINHHTA